MVYRRRYRRFKRRRFAKRRFIRRIKKRSTGSKVARFARKTRKYIKHKTSNTISVLPLPNTVVKRFSRINTVILDPFTMSTTGSCYEADYIIGHMINTSVLQFYQTQYKYWNLLSFTITFYIAETNNLVQLKNQQGSLDQYSTNQVTDPWAEPSIFVLHFNAPGMQSDYKASADIGAWNANPSRGKLNQRNKHTQQWLMPKSYYPTRTDFSAVTINDSIDSAFAGPVNYEPHGYLAFWPDAGMYSLAAGRCTVTLGFRIDSVFQFHDRKPHFTFLLMGKCLIV